MKNVPWVALGLTLLSLFAGSQRELELDRAAVLAGEWWRIVTGHFVHYGRAHAIGDIVAFAGWASVIELFCRRTLVIAACLSFTFVGLGVFWLCPQVSHYRGLSGIDVSFSCVLMGLLFQSPAIRRVPGARVLVALV